MIFGIKKINVYNTHNNLSGFFIAGINYKKTESVLRGLYAVDEEQYVQILSLAKQKGIADLFVLSTCNRTEIYGFAENANQLCKILCSQTSGDLDTFHKISYIKQGAEAIEHLFNVSAGLDSQILGDYEIVGQIKKAVKLSRQHNCMGGNLERLVNSALQASKEIKTVTALSCGTVSVSFAVVQYIREQVSGISNKNILLVGAGKIGKSTCKNIIDYLGTKKMVLINRTDEKAVELANELDIQYAPFDELDENIKKADIILVATNAATPVITRNKLEDSGNKLVFDLSIPHNVAPDARHLLNVTLITVDELSSIKDKNLENRKAEVPKAIAIISKHMNEYLDWYRMRQNIPTLTVIKSRLEQIYHCNLYSAYATANNPHPVNGSKETIQKVINGLAVKMKKGNQQGCFYIEAINEYMATSVNSYGCGD